MNKKKIVLIIGLILVAILFYGLDLFKYISIDNLTAIKDRIHAYGPLAPIVFIIFYIIATIFFLPGVPITLLSGLLFGPILGTIYVSIASTIGASLSFIIARYIGRDFIVKRFEKKSLFVKLDTGVKNNGWKMVVITRLVPIFPFNAQNYLYGLTDIPLLTFVFFSWLFMLPGTFAYVSLAGAIVAGQDNLSATFTYVGIGIALLLILSIVSKAIIKRQHLNEE
ncbi:TVP38/TMEM64 family protein [Acidaminobacter sp. JC074]|uniref:TVP38/TMEM64 family protein n=1 Tax=Acidaminobacter sp. JC074 TaxID=2530199 RepID=UPI001F0DA7B8|nr:TVP38/TMEM64 family protein [Acidaminobacter sp. JC074]MCH4891393.1 TVP38/TMEM64 family protein [Acidaminobacter sp. JC074]